MRSFQSIMKEVLLERFEQVGYRNPKTGLPDFNKRMTLSELVEVSKRNNSSDRYRELGILTEIAAKRFDEQQK